MGIPLSDRGFPPDGGTAASIGLARTYYVKRRTNGKAFTLGPYRAQHAPISGSEMIQASVGPMANASERVFFAKNAQVAQGDTLLCLENGQPWSVLFVQVWPTQVIAWVARDGVTVAGNANGNAPV